MSTIYLFRHAATRNNEKYDSRSAKPITRESSEEVKKISLRLKNKSIAHIYSSPVVRCKQTAKAISSIIKTPISYCKDLREIYFGDFEGKKYAEIVKMFPDYIDMIKSNGNDYRFPKGEQIREFQKRVFNSFLKIINENKNNSLLIITHKGVIQAIISQILEIKNMFPPFLIEPFGLTVIDLYKNNKFIIRCINSKLCS